MAGGPVEAGGAGTVIDVLAAVFPRPAVDAHAVVAAVGVVAGPAVLAGVGHQLALVYVLGAVLACGGPARHASTTGPGATAPGKPSQADSSTHCGLDRCIPAAPRPPGLAGPWPRRSAVGTGAPGGPRLSAIPSLAEARGTRLWRGPAWGAARNPHRRADGRAGASAPRSRAGAAPGHATLPGPRSPCGHCVGGGALPCVCTCPLGRAAAVVSVHAVHAGASVLAAVSGTVVDILLAVLAGEACGRGSQEPGQALPICARPSIFLAGPTTPCSGPAAAPPPLPLPSGPAPGCPPPRGPRGPSPIPWSPWSPCDQAPHSRAHV